MYVSNYKHCGFRTCLPTGRLQISNFFFPNKASFLGTLLVISLLLSFPCFLFSQKILVLDLYKWTGGKRKVFYEKQELRYRVRGSFNLETHTIQTIRDSSILFDNGREVFIRDIDRISVSYVNLVTHGLSRFFFYTGAGLIGLDIFNNTLNGEDRIVKSEIVTEGLILMTAGKLFQILPNKRYRMSPRRVLRIFDVGP